jgi:hypothetical protein
MLARFQSFEDAPDCEGGSHSQIVLAASLPSMELAQTPALTGHTAEPSTVHALGSGSEQRRDECASRSGSFSGPPRA